MITATRGERFFTIANIVFVALSAALCLFPILHVLAVSFSSSTAVTNGRVTLWPVEFSLDSYAFVLKNPDYFKSFLISAERTAIGLALSLFITILTAYPLSKEVKEFPQRTFYAWFFFVTMLFGGGLIPYYMTVKALGLINSIWVLVIPGALSVWNTLLLLNFMRGLPKDVPESAFVDGAGHWTTLWKIIIPMSKPVLATLVVFISVGHWNSWFDGLIFINNPKNFPLQTYLQSIVVEVDYSKLQNATKEELEAMDAISNRTFKAAQIFVATFPILCVYPFMQKHFVKGIVIGSVKE